MLVRRCVVAVLVCVLLVPATAHGATSSSWMRPVDGSVVRPFDPPQSVFGEGHLGVDLAAPPGTPVRAAGAGVVTFAGSVGGSLHVVVAHGGNLRTSYSFLASADVRRADRVARGDVIGRSGGTGAHHNGSVSHFGLRQGDTYVDPMQLFGPFDLAEVVHLAPVEEPFFGSIAWERAGIFEGLGGGAGGALGRISGHVTGASRAAIAVVTALGRPVVELALQVGRKALPALAAYLEHRFPMLQKLRYAALAITVAIQYVRHRMHCDDHAPYANGDGGSGHRVMLVAGLDSHTDGVRPALAISTEALGYEPDDVTGFSYSDTAAYDENHTYAPIRESALRLAEQLRELERREPGRQVDLIAHSQGGVVVLAFLELYYDPLDMSYPPLGTVVTLSSPLEGAPLATYLDRGSLLTRGGEIAWGIVGQNVDQLPIPDLRAPSLDDLSADSDLMADLAAAELPEMIELTTIGGATDLFVPGDSATTGGARHTIVGAPLWAHSSIVSEPRALRAVRSALESNDELPCVPFEDFVVGRLFPPVVGELENLNLEGGGLATRL